jgi:hypothetical protein
MDNRADNALCPYFACRRLFFIDDDRWKSRSLHFKLFVFRNLFILPFNYRKVSCGLRDSN